MGFYNVVAPCFVPGKGHYTNLPKPPQDIDDDVAAPLVESGFLERHRARSLHGLGSGQSGHTDTSARVDEVLAEHFAEAGEQAGEEFSAGMSESDDQLQVADEPKPRRGRRRSGD